MNRSKANNNPKKHYAASTTTGKTSLKARWTFKFEWCVLCERSTQHRIGDVGRSEQHECLSCGFKHNYQTG